jgi:starch phosphorylase
LGNPKYTSVPAENIPDPLAELALDLRWTWNHSTDELWRELDPELWEATQNAWLVLQTVSRDRLQRLMADSRFRDRVQALLEQKRSIESTDAWFQKTHPDSKLGSVAYFSMEYMLGEALPIYSGGLGNVAGDQLKAASDLGVPVVGIGLLYQQGYFRQEIDASGAQVARYVFNDPDQMPVRPVRNAAGDWLRLKLEFPGIALWIRAWEAIAGRRKLYLMDTNDPANLPAHRSITGELYGGGPETRLRQEIVLGIGGWRMLRALGLNPEVCHLNEGHTAFAVLERAHSFMRDHGQPFEVALAATRAGNLFTTHTPVDAGFDRFSRELIEKYFANYAEEKLKISLPALMALGQLHPEEPFNMAYLGIRGSGAVNGVSRLHAGVSRGLFASLFPRWPTSEVPVSAVTNGVHVPTWDSADADAVWEKACGQHRWRGSLEEIEENIRHLPDSEIWKFRASARKGLVDFTRDRLRLQRAYLGAPAVEIEQAGLVFDGNWLTLGFARRFAEYKRPNMLLHDPDRLARILTNPQRPVQLVVAGKAHPQDETGQVMIRQWNDFLRRPEIRQHAAFLADYDMLLTQELVAGVDLWLNTPRRPWEASGTSGMKVLANGGLNLSELDGWWAEAYAPDAGWAIGDGRDRGRDPGWDAAEANAVYSLLENEVIPLYYERDSNGIPRRWVQRVRESMARLTPLFSANRTVRQYTEEHYIPLAKTYRARAEDSGRTCAGLLQWERAMAGAWKNVRFGQVIVSRDGNAYQFEATVHLGGIGTGDVRVEIYADSKDSGEPVRAPMKLDHAVPGSPGEHLYRGAVPVDRPADHYTPRIIPSRNEVSVPLELPLIVWQK